MSEPTKQGVTISSGDKGVDRSKMKIANSSRVTTTADDHSVRTTTIIYNPPPPRKPWLEKSSWISAVAAAVVTVATYFGCSALGGSLAELSRVQSSNGDTSSKRAGEAQSAPPSREMQATPARPNASTPDSIPRSTRLQAEPPPTVSPSAPALTAPAGRRSMRAADGRLPAVAPSDPAPPAPTHRSAESGEETIDVEASGQPMEGLAAGSQEAYTDAMDTAMLLAKTKFLDGRRGEIVGVRTVEGNRTRTADTMTVAKGQVRGGRVISRSSIEEFRAEGVVHVKVRFPVSADVTPKLER